MSSIDLCQNSHIVSKGIRMTTTETPGSKAASEMERLTKLKEQGLLSNDEFERAKQLTYGHPVSSAKETLIKSGHGGSERG